MKASTALLATTRNVLVALLGSLLLLVGTAGPAAAHASLASTSPASGASLDTVDRISLAFTEPVELLPDAIRVLGAGGTRVAAGPATSDGLTVALPLTSTVDGGYVVTWRVVSEDGHPIEGTFSFAVGAAAPPTTSVLAGEDGLAVALRRTTTVLSVLGILVLAGAMLARRGIRDDGVRARVDAIVGQAAELALVASVLAVPARAALLLGVPLVEGLLPANLFAFAPTSPGRATILRIVALVAFGRLQRRGLPTWASLAAGTALLSFAVDGHSRTAEPGWLANASEVVHLGAGAAWLGGLVVLGDALRRSRRTEPAVVADLVARFSGVAAISLVAVTVTGSALATTILPPGPLGSSAYGQALVAKAGLVGILVAFGAYNRVALVSAVTNAGRPVLAGGSAQAVPAAVARRVTTTRRRGRDAAATLGRTVAVEGALFLLVVAVTGLLVDLSPPLATSSTRVGAHLDIGGGISARFDASVDPAGTEDITLRLIGPVGLPFGAESVRLVARNEALGLNAATFELTAVAGSPGSWQLQGEVLPLAGRWDLDVIVRTGRFDEEIAALWLDVPDT